MAELEKLEPLSPSQPPWRSLRFVLLSPTARIITGGLIGMAAVASALLLAVDGRPILSLPMLLLAGYLVLEMATAMAERSVQ